MSFMPSPGSFVRLADGSLGIISSVTPKGDDDRVLTVTHGEIPVTVDDIAEILWENELNQQAGQA